MPQDRSTRTSRRWHRLDGAAGGTAADLALYSASAIFAAVTAATSTLLPHRAWGSIATVGYLIAAAVAAGQLVAHRRGARRLSGIAARAGLTVVTWATTALLPMVWQAVERADGRTDRAQEEVVVIEHAGIRLLDHGTPYLGPDAIRALPAGEQLLGYTPYQPGMALFGLPRAIAGDAWWTDARIWFALTTAVALAVAVATLRGGSGRTGAGRSPGQPGPDPTKDHYLVRAVQLATILPICALTLATGGDDLPVLAGCLLALALGATRRFGAAGVVIGLTGALKLFAWPVAIVLLAYAATRGWRTAARFTAGAIGLPVAALIPVQLVDSAALVENVLRFPLGHGIVSSPAQSPFPGYLIAAALPAGRLIAAGLLVAAGVAIAVRLLRRPPHTAASAALICGYGLLAAIALMPSTRFGYLLYPIAFLAWAPALLPTRPESDPNSERDRPAAVPR
ncbi:glycosyltransferase family 87 protein [Micromonospora sp. NPDC050397]|uniref:glycosyltransferase family 87 protein n=1 Tax=Micromonospora sp. NPDC050397 TaxID=3364279 RepID=UPI0038501676